MTQPLEPPCGAPISTTGGSAPCRTRATARSIGSGADTGIPVAAHGALYAPDNYAYDSGDGTHCGTGYDGQILDQRTGALLGTFSADVPPVFGTSTGFFVKTDTLAAVDLQSQAQLWSFTEGGTWVNGPWMVAPILVNDWVFVGSSSGMLYALDAASGSVLWTHDFRTLSFQGFGRNYSFPCTGFGAGDGLLVIPAANTLTAFRLSSNP